MKKFFTSLVVLISLVISPIYPSQLIAKSDGETQKISYVGWSGDWGLKIFWYELSVSYTTNSNNFIYKIVRIGSKRHTYYIYPPEIGNGNMINYGVDIYSSNHNKLHHFSFNDDEYYPTIHDSKDIEWFSVQTRGNSACYLPKGRGYCHPIVQIVPPDGFTGSFSGYIKALEVIA